MLLKNGKIEGFNLKGTVEGTVSQGCLKLPQKANIDPVCGIHSVIFKNGNLVLENSNINLFDNELK